MVIFNLVNYCHFLGNTILLVCDFVGLLGCVLTLGGRELRIEVERIEVIRPGGTGTDALPCLTSVLPRGGTRTNLSISCKPKNSDRDM